MSAPAPELLPCPFCGCNGHFAPMQGKPGQYDFERGKVECVMCDVRTPTLSRAEAVKVWNRRVAQ